MVFPMHLAGPYRIQRIIILEELNLPIVDSVEAIGSIRKAYHSKGHHMRFKIVYLVIIFLTTTSCFSQDKRKGNLFFNVGPEYRITPIYNAGVSSLSKEANYTNIDLQNSGMALNIGAAYFLTHNLSIGFNNSFRHDIVTTGHGPNNTMSSTDRGLLIGYHFRANYMFEVFGKGSLIISLGYSLLNRNSEFSVHEPLYDMNGQETGVQTYLADYKFGSNSVSLGYGIGKSKLMIGLYIAGNSVYFNERTTFMIPFLTYSYEFGKL